MNKRVHQHWVQGQWIKRFFLANCAAILAILLNYIAYMPSMSSLPVTGWRTGLLAYGFMGAALIGQSALFALILGLLTAALASLFPKRQLLVRGFAVLISSLGLWFLLVDSLIYHLYHYHVAGLVWQVIKAGVATQILDLTWIEWTLAALIGVIIFGLELLLSAYLWKYVQTKKRCRRFQIRYIGLIAFGCLFLSYTLVLETLNVPIKNTRALVNAHSVVLEARTIPYYEKILGSFFPDKKGNMDLETEGAGFFVQNSQVNKPLHYPLRKLMFAKKATRKNIVIISLDAWRYDQMNPQSAPNIYNFSKKSLMFENNLSGGDCTRPGIFSLFYSLPGTYWTSFLDQKRGPVFINTLLKDHYRMGIFQSASLKYPAFNKTVFRAIKGLKTSTPGDNSVVRDKKITQEFLSFIGKKKTNKPFFSFMFYDVTHNYCNPPVSYPTPFKPYIKTCDRLMLNNHSNPMPYFNRYRNAIHFDDSLVGKVIAGLKAKHLLKNTIVILTSDHGEEFNESHLDYWGHASDYTPWQTHTPMVVYWPGKKHRLIHYRTSHYDIVPTLMKRVLGCKTPTKDYSVGHSLFKKGDRDLLIIASYIDYAIRLPHQVIRIYPQGNYAVLKVDGHAIPGAALNLKAFHKAYQLMNRFFK